jgi:hypothetical protein
MGLTAPIKLFTNQAVCKQASLPIPEVESLQTFLKS